MQLWGGGVDIFTTCISISIIPSGNKCTVVSLVLYGILNRTFYNIMPKPAKQTTWQYILFSILSLVTDLYLQIKQP